MWVTTPIAATQAPIHVDVPDEAVYRFDHSDSEVGQENGIWFVPQALPLRSSMDPDDQHAWQDRTEIFSGVDQVNLSFRLAILVQTLCKSEPEGQYAACEIEAVCCCALATDVRLVTR